MSKIRLRVCPYTIEIRAVDFRSPFRQNNQIALSEIIIYSDMGIEVSKIRLSMDYLRCLFKFFMDVYSDNLPFYLQIPPTDSLETSCISGEYVPILGYRHDYLITFGKINLDGKLKAVEVPMNLEDLNTILYEMEEILLDNNVFTEEDFETEDIDISYLLHHGFNRHEMGRR